MSIDAFIPEFWSARQRRFLDAHLVYAGPMQTNRDYEGEFEQAGDTLHLPRISGGGTIKNYTRRVPIDSPEYPDGTAKVLTIDQEKYYNIAMDDVDAVQVNWNMLDAWARRTARNYAVVIDAFVAGRMLAGVAAGNILGTDTVPVAIEPAHTGNPGAAVGGVPTYTPYQFAVEMRRRFMAANAPMDSRWMVIDEDLEAKFLADPKYIETNDRTETRTGELGRVAGFTILTTTAVPTSPGTGGTPVPNSKVIAGAGNDAVTVAHQLSKLVAYQPDTGFEDAIKGLEVYGAAVIEPETLALAHVR